MFRRFFASASRLSTGFYGTGVALTATAVAISDAELKKKPTWYQETVLRLERALKKLSLCNYVEDLEFLHDANDILQRVENMNNCEISWRLGRTFVEQSFLVPNIQMDIKKRVLLEGIGHLQKALKLEPAQGVAGAHKWYATSLIGLLEIDPRNPLVKGKDKEILDHLERAAKLDPKDAITHHLIGVQYFNKGKYDEALKNFRAAEEQKANYFVANLYYIGVALFKQGKKDESLAILMKALGLNGKSKYDRKVKGFTRTFLLLNHRQPAEALILDPPY